MVVSAFTLVFVVLWVPETKGRTLEEIQFSFRWALSISCKDSSSFSLRRQRLVSVQQEILGMYSQRTQILLGEGHEFFLLIRQYAVKNIWHVNAVVTRALLRLQLLVRGKSSNKSKPLNIRRNKIISKRNINILLPFICMCTCNLLPFIPQKKFASF
jgi:hypothetical protein